MAENNISTELKEITPEERRCRSTSMWISIRSSSGPEIRGVSCTRLVAADHRVAARTLLHRIAIESTRARAPCADKHKASAIDP